MLSFDVKTREELDLISAIVERAIPLYRDAGIDDDVMTMHMDITACHCSGCPLDLKKLLEAPDGDFGHDVLGIRRHINRSTGVIENCFLPRCAAPSFEAKIVVARKPAHPVHAVNQKGGQ